MSETDAPAMHRTDPNRGWDELAAPTIALLLDETRALLFGRAGVEPPSRGTIPSAVKEDAGVWRCYPWPHRGAETRGWLFAAVLTSSAVVRCLSSEISVADERTGAPFMLPPFDHVTPDLNDVLAWLDEYGCDRGDIAEFLVQTVVDGVQRGARIRSFLLDFLDAVSDRDGFVEVLGATKSGALLVQGWSTHLRPGCHPIILVADAPIVAEAVVAEFMRSDLPNEGTGIVILAEHEEIKRSEDLGRVYYRAPGGYFRLDALSDHCAVLGHTETAGHLRKMLPQLNCEANVRRHFERIGRAHFQGEDTASNLTVPVRIAVDFAVHAPGCGFFLTGWLLDPERRVGAVFVKSTQDFYRRLDGAWVRLSRPDVAARYETDALFRGMPKQASDNYGFMIFVPHPEPFRPRETFYLEIGFTDGAAAFKPIDFEEGPVERQIDRILAGIDPGHAEIDRIVRSHIGPIASPLAAARAKPVPDVARVPLGEARRCPSVSVIVPLRDAANIDVNLACFSRDPDFADAELIFIVHTAEAAAANALLRRQGAFYGLAGELLIHDAPLDRLSQLELGIRAAEAPHLLLLAPTVLPREQGWLKRLVEALAALPQRSALSPTLLYEDFSIRYAGAAARPERGTDAARASRFAGFPPHRIEETKPVAVAEATLDCCLMPRQLCRDLGGLPADFIGPELSSGDFANRLRQAGGECYWAPHVSLYGLDDHATDGDRTAARLANLIDRWSFDRKWAPGRGVLSIETGRLP